MDSDSSLMPFPEPKVEIMTFDGNPLKYWPFIRSFDNNVEKFCIGDAARMARLMQYKLELAGPGKCCRAVMLWNPQRDMKERDSC